MRIDGLTDVIVALERKALTVNVSVGEVLDTIGEHVRDTAKADVTVDTGRTRDSIEMTGEGLVREIGPTVPWGWFLENGTYKDPPQPFMFPAGDRHEPEMEEELLDVAGELW